MGGDDGVESYIRDAQCRTGQSLGPPANLPAVSNGSSHWWRWSGVPNTMASNLHHRRNALATLLGIPQPITERSMKQQTYSRACQAAWRNCRTRALREGQLQQHMQQFVNWHCFRRGAHSGGPYTRDPSYGQAIGAGPCSLVPVAASDSQEACGSTLHTDSGTLASGSTPLQHQIISSAALSNHAVDFRNYPNRGDLVSCPGVRIQEDKPVQKPKAAAPAQANHIWSCLKSSASRLATCNMEKLKWDEGIAATREGAAASVAASSSGQRRCQPPRFDAMEKEYQDHIMCCLDNINIGAVANTLFMASPSFRANASSSCGPARDPGNTLLESDLQDPGLTGHVNRAMLLLYVFMTAAAYYDGDNESAKDLANSQRHSAILLTNALMSCHGMSPWPYPELSELATLLSNLKALELSGNLPSKPFPESCTSLAMACRLTRAVQQLVETVMAPEVTSSTELALRAEKQYKEAARRGQDEQNRGDSAAATAEDGRSDMGSSAESQALSVQGQNVLAQMEVGGEANAVMEKQRQERQDGEGVGRGNVGQQEAEEAGAKAGTGSIPAPEGLAEELAGIAGRQVTLNTVGTSKRTNYIRAAHANFNAGVSTVPSNCSGGCSSSSGGGSGHGASTGHSAPSTDPTARNATGAADPREPLLNRNHRDLSRLQEELHKMRVLIRHRVYYEALTRHLGLIRSMPCRDWRAAGPAAFVEEYKRLATKEQESLKQLVRPRRVKREVEEKPNMIGNHHQQRRQRSQKQRLWQKDEGRQVTAALFSGAAQAESAGQYAASIAAAPAASGDAADQLPTGPNESRRLDVSLLLDEPLDLLRCEVPSMLCNVVPWNSPAATNEHGAAGGTGVVLGPLESMFLVRPFEDGSLHWRAPADPKAMRCDLARMLLAACLDGHRALFRAVGDAALQLALGATAAANTLLEPGILRIGAGSGELEYLREREIAGGTPVAVTLLGQPPCDPAGSGSGAVVGWCLLLMKPSISTLIQLVPVGDNVILRARQAAGRKISWWPLPAASAATAEHILSSRVKVLRGLLETALAKDSVAVLNCCGGRSTLAEAAQAIAQVHCAALRQRREQVLVFPLLLEEEQKDTALEAAVRMRSAYTYIATANKTVVSTAAATDSAVRLRNEDSESKSRGSTDTAFREPVEASKGAATTSASVKAASSDDWCVTGGGDFSNRSSPPSCSDNSGGAAVDSAAAAVAPNGCPRPSYPSTQTSIWPIVRHFHFNKELCRMLGLLPGQERILAKGILHLGLGLRNDDGRDGGGAVGADADHRYVLPGGPLLFTTNTRLTLVVLSLGVSGSTS
ncbi:hypothetical protein VaNZ11_014322 [Volvox africanus]|uniref:Uncharacterized protein n=1 Tax=Volvox africanus TaxID=51714 RepID=A0ABQ5SKD5_9CHLO|nr:hypothetical protein VaNZ11_014322 [Volvox africanus]